MSKKKVFLDIVKYIFFFSIGIGLFLWIYNGQNLDKIVEGMATFHFGWIAASFLVMLLSHIFRAMRWKMLIDSIGYHPRLLNTFLSILVMYLANFAFPRLGEVTRCGILKRYDGIPFTEQLGTVLIERICDVLFLLLMLAAVLLFNWDILSSMIGGGDSSSGKLAILTSPVFLITVGVLAAGTLVFFLFRRQIMNIPLVVKLLSFAGKFVEGLKSVIKLKQPLVFVLLTVGIYGCYYLGTLFIFKAFSPTASLSPMVALSVMALGSVGMVLPVPGGIGTFHYFALNTLLLYNVAKADGQLVVLVLHGSTTLFVILIGAIALGVLPIVNKKKRADIS